MQGLTIPMSVGTHRVPKILTTPRGNAHTPVAMRRCRDRRWVVVSAMCRKCLKTASDESRRCSTCGGRIVRFSDTGDVIEIEATMEEPSQGGGVPPLFANLETQYELAVPMANAAAPAMGTGLPQTQSAYAPPQPTALVGSSFGGAVASVAAPPNGYCQPLFSGAQPEVPAQANGHTAPVNGTYAQPINGQYQPDPVTNELGGLAPPLPMGYSEVGRPPASPPPPEPAGTFLMPVTQIDDVVSEILLPFGFERPAPVVEPPPPPPPFLVEPHHILGQPPQAVPEQQSPLPQIVHEQQLPPPPAVMQPQVVAEPQVVPQPQVVAEPQFAQPPAFPPPQVVQPEVAAPQTTIASVPAAIRMAPAT